MTGERSLRVNTRDEAGGDVDNTLEARTGNLISKVSDFLKRDNVIRWAEAGKTDDFVKEKLKLNGLSGNALIQHKNYQYFENFVMFKRSNQLTAWQTTDTPTYAVWRELGLGNVNTWDDFSPSDCTLGGRSQYIQSGEELQPRGAAWRVS
ncbi:RxLR effector protein [Phytophthora megakarya]|uniref:RxLR effector protein n=1 Tax=Phytophthora megakarya TaxID=4795 RepID=A0A225UV52_9STRA|nr:RxLR effector protein [Phytophthora megakarya]